MWELIGTIASAFGLVFLAEVGDKTLRLGHWIVDPESGKPWASMEAVALTFDTVTRKALAPSAEVRARVEKLVVPIRV